jgi:hypothetical protein
VSRLSKQCVILINSQPYGPVTGTALQGYSSKANLTYMREKGRSEIECPLANPTSGPAYSVFFFLHIIRIFSFNFTYPVRCFRVPPGVRLAQVEDHCLEPDVLSLSSAGYTTKSVLTSKQFPVSSAFNIRPCCGLPRVSHGTETIGCHE